ncbi:hypothetical protein Tco_0597086 [Tanacetum coccineum]
MILYEEIDICFLLPDDGSYHQVFERDDDDIRKWISTKRHNTKPKAKLRHGNGKDCAKSRAKVPKMQSQAIQMKSAVKPEPELKNTIGCNLNPSDGPGKPNSITMKTVKTKWALNQLQQPICVQLTKTVKTLKAQS